MGNSALAVELLEVSLDGSYDRMSASDYNRFPSRQRDTYHRRHARRAYTTRQPGSLK